MDRTKRRNPTVAFVLSLILPGLGHVYNGRLLQGILLYCGVWLLMILLALSGLISSLAGLICLIVAGIVCQLLIATHAATEASRLKDAQLKWYNS
jgi:signal peptidase I